MKNYRSVSFVLLILFLFFSSCMKEPTRDKPLSQSPVENNQNIGSSFAFPADTDFVDTPRLANLRLRHGIDLLKIIEHSEDRSGIDAMERALKREEVHADTELYIHLNVELGSWHARRREYEEGLKYWKIAEEAAQTDKRKYRMYLIFIYRTGAGNNAYLKHYSEAIRMRKILIEEYQGIGYGIRKNELAARSVEQLEFLSRFAKDEAENIKNYLIELSKKYRGSEVGLAAVTSLYDLSKQAGDQQKAQQYLVEMGSYPTTPEFRRYSEGVLRRWEQIEMRKEK